MTGKTHVVRGVVMSFQLNGYLSPGLAAVEGTVQVRRRGKTDRIVLRLGGTVVGDAGTVTDEDFIARAAGLFESYRTGAEVTIDCLDLGQSLWSITGVR